MLDRLLAVLKARFGSAPALSRGAAGASTCWPTWPTAASCGAILDKPVDPALLETLCAVALSAPSKCDLQQADIVIVSDKGQREKLEALLPDNPWVKAAPVFLVFCGNNRRHRLLFEWRGRPFVNDYLDPFFNAAVDAGIVLATFVAAADRAGLGSCPISAIRNHAQQVSDILGLPHHVFPVAALGVGWPSFEGVMSPRLGLDVTIHHDRYDEDGLKDKIARLRPAARGGAALQDAALHRQIRPERRLRLVGGQGAAIFGAGAGRFRRIRAPQGLQARLIVRLRAASST